MPQIPEKPAQRRDGQYLETRLLKKIAQPGGGKAKIIVGHAVLLEALGSYKKQIPPGPQHSAEFFKHLPGFFEVLQDFNIDCRLKGIRAKRPLVEICR